MTVAQQVASRKRIPRFPIQQMTILALCRICEPIAFMSIFPYVYFMIQNFENSASTGDPSKDRENSSRIAIYAGLVTSAFAFAEFSSGIVWGRLSDRIGRKPVLLFGLFGTALSMLIFGLSPSLPVALLARALGGLLNGNIGVLQTTVAEMITVKEHQPRAYTVMPFVWCLGSILGPMLGSAFANPVDEKSPVHNSPLAGFFVAGSVWEKFPYLLPNLVITFLVSGGVVIGFLFLEETHAEKKHRRDPGLEIGRWIIKKLCPCADSKGSEKAAQVDELRPLLSEEGYEQPPGYRTNDGSPCFPSNTPSPEPQDLLDLNASDVGPKVKPAVTKAFTREVVLNVVGYGILAYHTMTLDSMLPTHLAAGQNLDEHNDEWSLPFKFLRSYNLVETQIGFVLAFQGVYSMLATVFIFPIVCRRLGALRLFRIISIAYPILYFSIPYFVLLPDSLRTAGIYAMVIWKCSFATMAYPSNAILLTNSAPSLLMLGTINGVAASTASLARAFGPFISGTLFSIGLRVGYSGLAWWCSALIAVLGAIVSLYMTDKGGRLIAADEKSDEEDEEAAFEDHILDHTALDHGVTSTEPRISDRSDDSL